MTALYFSALRPEDRVAVKPHASPVFHAMQYLMGNQTRKKMEDFRGFGGVRRFQAMARSRAGGLTSLSLKTLWTRRTPARKQPASGSSTFVTARFAPGSPIRPRAL